MAIFVSSQEKKSIFEEQKRDAKKFTLLICFVLFLANKFFCLGLSIALGKGRGESSIKNVEPKQIFFVALIVVEFQISKDSRLPQIPDLAS